MSDLWFTIIGNDRCRLCGHEPVSAAEVAQRDSDTADLRAQLFDWYPNAGRPFIEKELQRRLPRMSTGRGCWRAVAATCWGY